MHEEKLRRTGQRCREPRSFDLLELAHHKRESGEHGEERQIPAQGRNGDAHCEQAQMPRVFQRGYTGETDERQPLDLEFPGHREQHCDQQHRQSENR